MNEEVLVILGVRPYSFKDDKTQNVIEGATFHVVNNSPDDRDVTGSITDHLSVSTDTLKAFMQDVGSNQLSDLIGVSVAPIYNKRGKVRRLDVVDINDGE